MEYYGGVLIANSDLYHHGILGQKWGKRNGPPYPLGSSAHSSAEKKAGWRKSLSSGSGGEHTGLSRDVRKLTRLNKKQIRLAKKELRVEKKQLRLQKKQYKIERAKEKKEQLEAAKKQREFNKLPLEERQKIWKEETKKYYTENKDRMLENAKNNDQWDIEFLERTGDEWSKKPISDKLKDYEKYINKMSADGSSLDRYEGDGEYGSIFSKSKKKKADAAAKTRADKIVEERIRQKKEDEYFEKNKSEILRSAKAKDILTNQSRLTNAELQEAVTRLNLNSQLSTYADKQAPKSNWDKVDNVMNRVNQMTNWTRTGIAAWNELAKIYNATPQGQKEKLPLVGQGGGGDNNQQQKKK